MDSDEHRRGPTCYRHDAVVGRVSAVETELKNLALRMKAMEDWKHDDELQSQWFYANSAALKQLVAASKWAVMTRSVAAWLIGIIVSVVATLGWLRENIGHFIK